MINVHSGPIPNELWSVRREIRVSSKEELYRRKFRRDMGINFTEIVEEMRKRVATSFLYLEARQTANAIRWYVCSSFHGLSRVTLSLFHTETFEAFVSTQATQMVCTCLHR